MTARKPTMPEVMTRALASLKVGIRTVVTANVVSYNSATQSAAVQPAPRVRNGGGELVALGQVVDAPVWFPSSGGWSISWPLIVGDPVLLLVADRDIDRWRLTGATYDPDAVQLHDVTNSFVLPGGGPTPDPVTGISATDLTISGPGGIAFRVTPAGIISLAGGGPAVARVGDTVGQTLAMATWMSQVATAINALAPGSVSPPAPASFAAITSGSALVNAG